MKQMIQRIREEEGGFTLAELLIVVAIIAVLVAIAIPVFTTQLNNAKRETDVANARSYYAVTVAEYMTSGSVTTSYNYGYALSGDQVTLTGGSGNSAPVVTINANGYTESTFGGK